MKKLLLTAFAIFLIANQLFSQSDCSNPTHVNICPPVLLLNQTNAGMGDDAPAPCNITGEDVVYELSAPNGARQIYVSVLNATGPMTLLLEEMVCGTGLCTSSIISAGNSNSTFNVSNPNTITTFYLWADAQNTVTYDISFGADTGSVWINTPNLMGNLQFDSSQCVTPVFNVSKPFFNVTYNGIAQTHPMTLSPLNVPGTMCVSTSFKNTTGIEGVKKFNFKFNGSGYASVVGSPSVAGSYNLGNWVTGSSGLNWNYSFNDLAGIGKGDFLGIPNTCLTYKFCFTVIPVSNDPLLTNVDVSIYGDGFGQPYSGFLNTGCCPVPFVNCLGSNLGPGSGSGASAFGFGFADPGGPLPIQLLEFKAVTENKNVKLKWITATEINNDYFTIQRTYNGLEWENVASIDGAGNSNSEKSYTYTDKHPLDGTSYYRLKQTDFNGATTISKLIKVRTGNFADVRIYPNPANQFITIETENSNTIRISLFNLAGQKQEVNPIKKSGNILIDTKNIADGMYFLILQDDDMDILQTKMIIQKN